MDFKYYKSDFNLIVTIGAEYMNSQGETVTLDNTANFVFRFYTTNKNNPYICSSTGGATPMLVNCSKLDNDKVVCHFDRSLLAIDPGQLYLEAEFIVPDNKFEGDDIENVVRLYSTNVVLTIDPDKDTEGEFEVMIGADFIQGADGKSAYDLAVEGGYEGTEEEFAQAQRNAAELGSNISHKVANLEGAFSGTSPILDFSTDTEYGTGANQVKYCYKDGLLYKATTTHTGEWNASHFEEKVALDVMESAEAAAQRAETAAEGAENVNVEVVGSATIKITNRNGEEETISLPPTEELLQLNLQTDQVGLATDPLLGVSVQVVTPSGDYLFNGTWQGQQISVFVGFGIQYKVILGQVGGYVTPTTGWYYPVNRNVRNLTLTYVQGSIDVIYIDDSIADPAQKVSGDINGAIIGWIKQNTHNYLCKYVAADDKMYACQLSDNSRLLFHDGTAAVTSGSMGDVMSILPEFWTKWEIDSQGRHKISFSKVEVVGWKKWGGLTDALGCYEMVVRNSMGYSIAGVGSTGNFTKDNGRTYARNRGTGFSLVKWWHQNIYGTLFYAIYGHTNCQEVCGYGTPTIEKICGADTDALGMQDTVHGGNGDSGSINFLGLENWWGNKAEWFDNVVFNQSAVDYIYRITEDDGTVRSVQGHTTASQNQFKRGMTFGDNLDLVGTAASANGTDSTGYCDNNYHGNQTARVVCRSGTNAGTHGGVAFLYAVHAASYAYASIGSRLAFHGAIEIVADVEEFLDI